MLQRKIHAGVRPLTMRKLIPLTLVLVAQILHVSYLHARKNAGEIAKLVTSVATNESRKNNGRVYP